MTRHAPVEDGAVQDRDPADDRPTPMRPRTKAVLGAALVVSVGATGLLAALPGGGRPDAGPLSGDARAANADVTANGADQNNSALAAKAGAEQESGIRAFYALLDRLGEPHPTPHY